ncbi:MAG: hypothetical protein L6Q59_14870 [Ignavibacteriaceae bacterium]|nr:hypothetical protein [Ignavibacteriaceae bacterium]
MKNKISSIAILLFCFQTGLAQITSEPVIENKDYSQALPGRVSLLTNKSKTQNLQPAPIEDESTILFFFGGTIGFSGGNAKNALDDFEKTEFNSQNPNYAAAVYLAFGTGSRFALGIKYASYTLRLVEEEVQFGDLTLNPIMLSLRFQRLYNDGVLYIDANLGYSKNEFAKGRDMRSIEAYYSPAVLEISNESSLFWGLAMGYGFKVTKYLYLVLEGEVAGSSVKTSWYAVSPYNRVKVDFEKFKPTVYGGRVGLMFGI